ncbi:hypothetical protein CVT26_013369 [Gymnopilus dilepis]|uniref:Mucoidy inhibitor A n=1 Tax=Gymnopilus dilepis TaxID=231916 RepID=A0A409VUW2_9AGAR|nr:hypothetical protein CVT26_013369 [Gymnopilus dilepis]
MSDPSSVVPPPAFQSVNTIDLASVDDSKIIGVSVYSERAEVTRLLKVSARTGLNQLAITGLPAALEQDSFKVEGRGAATIHDPDDSTLQKKRTEKALARTLKSLASLEGYITSVKAENLDASKLKETVHHYESTAEELDEKVSELELELQKIEDAIIEETKDSTGPEYNEKLNLKATISIFADVEGEVEIALVYGVKNASWVAGYDLRVDMQTKDKPVTLIYKGSITQSTGEDWKDVPLTLETAAPTFGLSVPTLNPWTLTIYRPALKSLSRVYGAAATSALDSVQLSSAPSGPPRPSRRGSNWYKPSSNMEEPMEHRELNVSKGTVSATFTVPGLISIPTDGVGHNVTIVKLSLDADMSWVCVPKKDTRVHLKARVKNASEYSLLPGKASVYVDKSFISKSDIPLVSPEESFDCPLGLDPSIRVTYHPRTKKVSESGFYSKSFNHTSIQRVTVHNTKTTTLEASSKNVKLRVMDQVPVSEDSSISVKLVQPALAIANRDGTSTISNTKNIETKAAASIKISSGVMAMWDGADELADGSADEVAALGSDGRFSWICDIPPQGKVGLTLQWEVSAPARSSILGL